MTVASVHAVCLRHVRLQRVRSGQCLYAMAQVLGTLVATRLLSDQVLLRGAGLEVLHWARRWRCGAFILFIDSVVACRGLRSCALARSGNNTCVASRVSLLPRSNAGVYVPNSSSMLPLRHVRCCSRGGFLIATLRATGGSQHFKPCSFLVLTPQI